MVIYLFIPVGRVGPHRRSLSLVLQSLFLDFLIFLFESALFPLGHRWRQWPNWGGGSGRARLVTYIGTHLHRMCLPEPVVVTITR